MDKDKHIETLELKIKLLEKEIEIIKLRQTQIVYPSIVPYYLQQPIYRYPYTTYSMPCSTGTGAGFAATTAPTNQSTTATTMKAN